MAIVVTTQDPERLLTALKNAIAEGRLSDWSIAVDGDLIASSSRCHEYACFEGTPSEGMLVLRLVGIDGAETPAVYGYFQSLMVAVLLLVFNDLFDHLSATSKPLGAHAG